MTHKNDKWCPAPWVTLDISQNGNINPCCRIEDSNYKFSNIQEYLNSDWLKTLKNNLSSNIKDPRCTTCWNEELYGGYSLRQDRRKFYSKNTALNKQKILHLQIVLDNTCNLKCRICNYRYSSKWASEMLNNLDIFSKNAKELILNQRTEIKNNDIVNVLKNNLEFFDLAVVELTGGETFLSDKHSELLKMLISYVDTKKIKLVYVSNGTTYPQTLIENVWPYFKKVIVNLSIDDLNARFEYQRHPALWTNILKNLEKFKENKINLSLYQVLSIFNVLYLEEYEDFAKSNNLFWFYQTLEHPKELCIINLPKRVKEHIIKKYENKQNVKAISTVIKMCQTPSLMDENTWRTQFFENVGKIDKIRNENFAETFPELYNLLNK